MECTIIIKDSTFQALNSIWLIENEKEIELIELKNRLKEKQSDMNFRLQYFINSIVDYMKDYRLYLVERKVPAGYYLETILYFYKK